MSSWAPLQEPPPTGTDSIDNSLQSLNSRVVLELSNGESYRTLIVDRYFFGNTGEFTMQNTKI